MGISNISTTLLTQRYGRLNEQRYADSMRKLASGRAISRASDNPAGLIASEQLSATLAQLEAESKSLQRSDYVASTADGALAGVSDLLSEANGLAVANANDAGLSDAEKQANQLQIDSILATVDRVSSTTSFNGTKLLDGSASLTAVNKSLPIDSTSTTNIGKVSIDGHSRTLADVRSGGAISALSDPEAAQKSIQAAISAVSRQRGQIGAFQKNTVRTRLGSIDSAYANISSAQSQIRDLDYALEASRKARFDLLRQTSAILTRPHPMKHGYLLDVIA